jgi:uncharacterized protein (DUF4415 family)
MGKTGSSQNQERDLQALRLKTDAGIDTTDSRELDWSNAERGRFYRPVKQMVSLRIDADILDWFKSHHPKYQTALNQALREHINHQ